MNVHILGNLQSPIPNYKENIASSLHAVVISKQHPYIATA